MKREIKFRVWHPILGMQLPFDMFQATSFKYDNGDGTKCLEKYFEPECIFLQFTGLSDKNGKEIYEGDIVRSGYNGVIEFGNGKFGINWDYGTDNKSMLGSWGQQDNLRTIDDGFNESIEIIGNVFENPELVTPS